MADNVLKDLENSPSILLTFGRFKLLMFELPPLLNETASINISDILIRPLKFQSPIS